MADYYSHHTADEITLLKWSYQIIRFDFEYFSCVGTIWEPALFEIFVIPHFELEPNKRDLEAQLDETLASLRMEKALVCGELSEEENMLQPGNLHDY